MFYDKLNINGVEYQLHTTLTGEGPPPESLEANVGMRYMDTESEAYYKKTHNGWQKEIVDSTEYDGQHWDSVGVSLWTFSNHVVECAEKFFDIENNIGDIDTALDSILAIQNTLIGGDSV